MPARLIPLYAIVALALGAILALAIFAIPAFAVPAISIELGFLESVDDPSKLHIGAPSDPALADSRGAREAAERAENSGAWRRGLGPVWVWNPAPGSG